MSWLLRPQEQHSCRESLSAAGGKAADAAVAARLELQNAQLQLRDLEAYNRYMQSLVADQQNELGKLSQQLEAVQETRQGLIPLMLQMQADLEQLVQNDIPLRKEDRLARVEQLKATLARADVSEAEKFRQLLQAYQIEAEYGSRMDSYSAELELDGAPRRVDVLALGRVSLLAMTADRSQAWRWSAEAKQWQALDSQWLSPIAEAMDVAADKKFPSCSMSPSLSAAVRRPNHESHHEVVPPPYCPLLRYKRRCRR